jgi:hypothetical protein
MRGPSALTTAILACDRRRSRELASIGSGVADGGA